MILLPNNKKGRTGGGQTALTQRHVHYAELREEGKERSVQRQKFEFVGAVWTRKGGPENWANQTKSGQEQQ